MSWTWRWLTVFERNSGTALWANGTRSDWYCGLAGRGRGAGKGAAGHGTETATSAERGWIRFEVRLVVRALLLNRRDNSLNGSQCCIGFGWRVQVEAKVCVHLEGAAVQAKMGWLRGWIGWGAQDAKGTQEIGLHTQTRPNGMGRRLQGWDRWATAVRGWLISATTIGKECWTVLIKYCQYNNRAMNESNRFAEHKTTQLRKAQGWGGGRLQQGLSVSAHQTRERPKGLEAWNTQRHAALRCATQRYAVHHTTHTSLVDTHFLVGGRTCHDWALRLEGLETTIKSKPQMLEGAAQGGAGDVGRQSI